MFGETLALAAALNWAFAIILFKRSESVGAQGMNLFKNTLAIVLLVATMPVLGVRFDLDRPAGDWALLALSGILGIAVADTLIFMALARLGPALLAVVDLCYAPFIVTLSLAFLGEEPGPAFMVGAGLVVGGVAVAIWPGPRRARPPQAMLIGVALGVVGILSMAFGVIVAKRILEAGSLVEVMLVRLLAGVAGQLLWILVVPSHRGALRVFRPSPAWKTLIPAAFLGSYVAMLLWLGGFKWADASVAAVLNQTSAVFTILLARLLLGDTLTRRQTAGAGLALAGAMVVLVG